MLESNYSNGEYLAKNPSWHVEDSPWKANNVRKMIEKHQLQPASVCEIGCGFGEILKELQKVLPASVKFHGYEVSEDAFHVCQQKNNDKLQFSLGNLLEESNKDFYDMLLVMDVFEHVEDYFSFLKGCREKATYKLFHIPLDISMLSLLRRQTLLKTRKLFGHIQYFTKDTALATLEDTGYEIVDFCYTGSSIDLPVKSLKGKMAKVPRKLLFSLDQDLAAKTLGGYSLLVLAK
jgi:cyclopropane fatty-acyl-phospholipid synthase-like methyltransferase